MQRFHTLTPMPPIPKTKCLIQAPKPRHLRPRSNRLNARFAQRLLDAAEAVPRGRDAKLQALVKLLESRIAGQKALVFTEYRDTLRAASRRLDAAGISHVVFHGGTPEAKRNEIIQTFLSGSDIRVFLATDAASEGMNLQHGVHHLVHLDVPWNPNRYLQRNGRIDRYGQTETPHIWALVAADRKGNAGRPEYRALEIVIEKLQRIAKESGSVGQVLPNFTSGRVREVLTRSLAHVEAEAEGLVDDDGARRVGQELTRLTLRNRDELQAAERYVAQLGTVDDFHDLLEPLLRTTFHGWDDGGSIADLGGGIVNVAVPHRLRRELAAEIPRATFNRQIAVASQAATDEDAIEFLTPAHPLIDATLRAIRDDARDPMFPHRFDVAVSDKEGLVISFVARYVDGESRTADERLLAVEVSLDAAVSADAERDMARLGVDDQDSSGHPSAARIGDWRTRFDELARSAARKRSDGRWHTSPNSSALPTNFPARSARLLASGAATRRHGLRRSHSVAT